MAAGAGYVLGPWVELRPLGEGIEPPQGQSKDTVKRQGWPDGRRGALAAGDPRGRSPDTLGLLRLG